MEDIKLTNCCNAYSTYYEEILCCKNCYKAVSEGEGDGTQLIDGTQLTNKKYLLIKLPKSSKETNRNA
tara:strand:+ start:271 stop:474 length:204 start_codon:yes stop_codon:yes gene_type:complete